MEGCHICGKKPSGIFGPNFYRCRICKKLYCGEHGKDGKCNICREKLGELKR